MVILLLIVLSIPFFSSVIKPTLKAVSAVPLKFTHSIKKGYYKISTKPKHHLSLDVSFDNYQTLQKKRLEALDTGVLLTSGDDFVPAKIRYQNNSYQINIRLKGDWLDQVEGDLWGMRIKVGNDKVLFGTDKFSLHPPGSRHNLNEWIFLQAISSEGVIALNYDFVLADINGEHQGIYAFEEHFSKYLLERNQRRESPILKFNEDQLWQNAAVAIKIGDFNQSNRLNHHTLSNAFIEAFQPQKIDKDPELSRIFDLAQSKLEAVNQGQLDPIEVFDQDIWTTYLALSDVFGAQHGLAWHNLRFYYNPITSLFEPIPFDSMPGNITDALSLERTSTDIISRLMKHPSFKAMYIEKLNKFSQSSYIDSLISKHQANLDNYQRLIRRDNPNYVFNPSPFYQNAAYACYYLTTAPTIHISSLPRKIDSTQELLINNLSYMPITIDQITTKLGKELINSPIIITQTRPPFPEQALTTARLNSPTSKNQAITLKYHANSVNIPHIATISAIPNFYQDKSTIPSTNTKALSWQSSTKTYHLYQGSHQVTQTIIIPVNSKLIIHPGTKLDLINHAGIISYSPIHLLGQSDNPIKITSSDQTSQGIAVINTSETSHINSTAFSNLSSFTNEINTTGSITFYQSPVNISHSTIINNHSEDALNITNSQFNLNQLGISNTSLDAIDIDFSTGFIGQVTFNHVGNDALDFSQSNVNIVSVNANSVADKAISIGEQSIIKLDKLVVTNSNVGLAVKDLSQLDLNHITYKNISVGIAVYQKKPEYGPAMVKVKSADINQVLEPFLVETNSLIKLPSTIIQGTKINLKDRFL